MFCPLALRVFPTLTLTYRLTTADLLCFVLSLLVSVSISVSVGVPPLRATLRPHCCVPCAVHVQVWATFSETITFETELQDDVDDEIVLDSVGYCYQ